MNTEHNHFLKKKNHHFATSASFANTCEDTYYVELNAVCSFHVNRMPVLSKFRLRPTIPEYVPVDAR